MQHNKRGRRETTGRGGEKRYVALVEAVLIGELAVLQIVDLVCFTIETERGDRGKEGKIVGETLVKGKKGKKE